MDGHTKIVTLYIYFEKKTAQCSSSNIIGFSVSCAIHLFICNKSSFRNVMLLQLSGFGCFLYLHIIKIKYKRHIRDVPNKK